MKLVEEQFNILDEYKKKYGDKTVVMHEKGGFFEMYGMLKPKRGHDLDELHKITDIRIGVQDSSIKKINIDNAKFVGFPTVAYDKYIDMIMTAGYVIVVVRQFKDKEGFVTRKIDDILTSGTWIDNPKSDDAFNLISIYIEAEKQKLGNPLICIGMSVVDLTTGQNTIHEAISTKDDEQFALDEAKRFLNTYKPKEIIVCYKNPPVDGSYTLQKIKNHLELNSDVVKFIDSIDKNMFKSDFQETFFRKICPKTGLVKPFEYLGLDRKPYAAISYLLVLDYAYQHNENIIMDLPHPSDFHAGKYLVMGNDAVLQLDLINTQSISDHKIKCLFDVVNFTSTAIGRRLLKQLLLHPIIDVNELNKRYDKIEELVNKKQYLRIEKYLKKIHDIERYQRKLVLRKIQPFELDNMLKSYINIKNLNIYLLKNEELNGYALPDDTYEKLDLFIKKCDEYFIISKMNVHLSDIKDSFLQLGIYSEIDDLNQEICKGESFVEDLRNALEELIKNDVKTISNKNIIRIKHTQNGFHFTLTNKRTQILKKKLKKIDKLKVNKKFSLDVSQLKFQELKNSCNIQIEEMRTRSDRMIALKEALVRAIKNTFEEILIEFKELFNEMFGSLTNFIGWLDCFNSGAKCADTYFYTRPKPLKSTKGSFFNAKHLRHPIIERIIGTEYVPHNIKLGYDPIKNKEHNGMLIYGLNSSGKSSLMKAIGLCTIIAQAGFFVPTTKLEFVPYHSIYARISGHDNLFKGESSFVLEMNELRAILQRCNKNSLIIGDEVCRSTEHLSATAIVATTIIHLSQAKSSFVFATHLHSLVKLEDIKSLSNVKCYHLTVQNNKENKTLIFDRKLKPGTGDSIYGITVARHIIQHIPFLKKVQKIKNEILENPTTLFHYKISNYNGTMYMIECNICGRNLKAMDDKLHTHHIHHQKDTRNGFVIDKPYLLKNGKSNLTVLCKACHTKLHSGKLDVDITLHKSIV
jgi:DNA mismatch repair protein MutS